ncbi:MAG: hypothetical protein LBR93_01215, partial [Treponema sp.]|nr:hypothetical protein [Treponema sp.]
GEAAGLQTTKGEGPFSEIGFYNKKAKWPDVIKKNDEMVKLLPNDEMVKPLPEDRFSRIDVLNIQSTGDIESRAENYHLLKAKRIEFLAGTDEVSPETRADNCRDNFSSWESGEAPLGDNPLDDPAVHKGDAHFRAGRRIVIKAVGEIRLQVGRTTLLINDDGFSVVTRKVNSNIPVPSDTSFSMKARDGISMFGESVAIASARKFSVSDAWGASVGSMVGVLNISGQQINQKTYDKFKYGWATVFNGITLAQNTIIGGIAADYPKKAFALDWWNYGLDVAKFLLESIRDIWDIGRVHPFKTYEEHLKALQRIRSQTWLDMAIDLLTYNSNDPAAFIAMDNAANNPFNGGPVTAIQDVFSTASMLAGADPVDVLMAGLDLVLAITAMVYATAEQEAAREQRVDLYGAIFDGKTKYWDAQKKSDFKDTLNLCALCIDAGIIEICMGINLIYGLGGPASIRLRQSGDIVIKASEQKGLYAELKQEASVPPAIALEKTTANVKTALAVTKMVAGVGKLVMQGESMGNKIPAYMESL